MVLKAVFFFLLNESAPSGPIPDVHPLNVLLAGVPLGFGDLAHAARFGNEDPIDMGHYGIVNIPTLPAATITNATVGRNSYSYSYQSRKRPLWIRRGRKTHYRLWFCPLTATWYLWNSLSM